MFGLDPDTLREIRTIFTRFENISKVILYGSRAKGNYRKGSDIYFTLFGDELNLQTVYAVEEELEKLYLHYSFDIAIFSHIDNQNLIQHIRRVGKVFYQKKRELPEGWKIKKLGDVCDFQGGAQPPKSNFRYEPKDGYIRFLRIRDFKSNKKITYIPISKKNRYCNAMLELFICQTRT